MGYSSPPLRKQPINSLAAKIIFVVFLSTFLTALVVSWISLQSTYGFLHGQIDRRFPSVLTRTSDRILAWLAGGRDELEQLAADPSFLLAVSARRPAGNGDELLGEAIGGMEFFDALVLVDPSGERVAVATRKGAPPPPAMVRKLAVEPAGVSMQAVPDAAGAAVPVASISLVRESGRDLGILHGVFHRAALREMLAADEIGPSGEIYLVDEAGRRQLESGAAGRGPALLAADLSGEDSGRVREYRGHSGQQVVGAALPLGALGWTLVVEQPLEEAFEPVFSVMTRVFVIDLCIILLFSFFAYQVTSTIVQPIEALSDGARRISRGELEVEIQVAKGNDEVALLTRTFNDMSRKLLRQRTEIRQVNRQLLAQNDELQRANEVLEQLSITDGLTRLHNHRFFQEHLNREIKRVDRSGDPLSLLLLDIDDFKQLNDRFGHVAGDELLARLGRILNDSIRETDLIARYGGDEFAVLAANTDIRGAVALGEKMRTATSEAAFILGDSMRPTKMTVSIGVAQYRGSRKQVFREADRALYRAKDQGKDCVVAEADEPPGGDPSASDRET